MCGRYAFIPGGDFDDRFEIVNREVEMAPDYNVSPGMIMPVITASSPKKIEMMKWGLVPHWAREPRVSFSTINARSEEIETKPVYKKAFQAQRCLVPASGFFEWKKATDRGKAVKFPYWICLKNREIFGFAGIYDIWKDVEGKEFKTFAIVTTVANKFMSNIHDRMPVILSRDNEEKWLDNKVYGLKLLKNMMQPYPSDEMDAYRVSLRINNPQNNDRDLINKLEE